MSTSSSSFENRRLVVDVFAAALGISAWVAINGLWTQTPILTTQLPEKWSLASHIVLLTQIANIGPLIYGLYSKKLKPHEDRVIHFTLFIGTLASALLAIFWRQTVNIGSKERSLPILVLTLFLAMVDCTSSVLYLPYMANFKSKYLMAFFIGEGLSGFLPSMIALFQGVGGEPRCVNISHIINGSQHFSIEPHYPEPKFSMTIFCVLLTAIMIFSWISFTVLNSSFCESERVRNNSSQNDEDQTYPESPIMHKSAFYLNKFRFRYLLLIQAATCALTNGFMPSIQSYSCAPYGTLTYNLAVKIAGLANPICSFFAFFYKKNISLVVVNICTLYGLICTFYIVITALTSPEPPLQDNAFGSLLLIFAWVSFTGSFAYVKSCIASLFRDHAKQGHVALFWVGVFTQVGSFSGAIISFCLISYGNIFVSYDPCANFH